MKEYNEPVKKEDGRGKHWHERKKSTVTNSYICEICGCPYPYCRCPKVKKDD